jgi:hypothetical protein
LEAKQRIIEAILDLELEMFLSVPSDGESDCQHHPEAFKFHRRLQFSVWSLETLNRYRRDLMHARQKGENLMTVKYARMQGLLPSGNTTPLIDEILRMKMEWQAEMIRRYPAIMGGARPLTEAGNDDAWTSFERYARGELEAYSDATLASLHADLRDMQEKGVNASEKIYRLQAAQSGFDSLEAAEAHMQRRKKVK